jgi:phage-related minor tail protein
LSEVLASKEYGVNAKIADTRNLLNALASSGKFTSQAMMPVAEVLSRIAKLSGETGEEVFKKLGGSFDGTASSAKSLNETFNFLTLGQYKYIEQLERQGKRQEAAAYTANLLNDSLKGQVRELGTLEKVLSSIGRGWSSFWDSVYDIGRTATPEQELKKLADLIELYSPFAKIGLYKKEFDDAKNAYLKMAADLAKKQEDLNKDADVKAKRRQELDEYNRAGGITRTIDLEFEAKKQAIEAESEMRMQGANEFTRIEVEAFKEKELAKLNLSKRFRDVGYGLETEERKALAAKLIAIDEKATQKKLELSRQKELEFSKKQFQELDSIEKEKEKLQLYKDSILISEEDYKIGLARLETEQKIAEIMREQNLSPEAKDRLIENQVKLGEAKESVLKLGDQLQTLRSINQSVFSNMGSAIDNFVRTGKFAFKDFARSVIQDIIAIQLKAQATKLLSSAFSAFSGSFGGAGPTQLGGEMAYIGPAFADGGSPPVGVPSLVGERGPELFVPRTAGTIIPNHQLSSAMAQPQIVYNGPYIANMSAIDTQSGVQFLMKNKESIWSANQSASRSLPASR